MALNAKMVNGAEIIVLYVLNRKLIYEELHAKAKDKETKEIKRKKKARDDFASELKRCRTIKEATTWEEAKAMLENVEIKVSSGRFIGLANMIIQKEKKLCKTMGLNHLRLCFGFSRKRRQRCKKYLKNTSQS